VPPDDRVLILAADARIQCVELTGLRAAGPATPLADWYLTVTTADFESVRDGQQVPEPAASRGTLSDGTSLESEPPREPRDTWKGRADEAAVL
jgi:hypothetical protein